MMWTGPLGAQPLELPLGLATGSNDAQISLDGKKWDTLTAVSSLVFDKTMIRTGSVGLRGSPCTT